MIQVISKLDYHIEKNPRKNDKSKVLVNIYYELYSKQENKF